VRELLVRHHYSAGNPARSTIEWCGHRIEGIPVPDVDGRWQLIVVEGEAK